MIKEMGRGHLGIRLNLESQDEIGEMAMTMDEFADDLQNVVIGTMNQISAGDVSADIEGSIERVGVGTKIADETAESLKEILNEIEKVTSLVGNIAQASTDQASEIAQITQGIEQVSQVVQTNSATAEESAAASQELSGQAEMLKVMVGAFKLKDQSRQRQEPLRNTQYQKAVEDQPQIILDDLEFDKY